MVFIIMNVSFLVLTIIFILTKRFWEKNTISLAVCLFIIGSMFVPLFPDDNSTKQILIIITTLILDAAIITFLFAGKIAGSRFSRIVQDRNSAIAVLAISLCNFTISILVHTDSNIYKLINMFLPIVLAPFIEEYCLRGIVFLHIQKQKTVWKRWLLYAAVSVMFMAAHIVFKRTVPELFLFFLMSLFYFTIRELWHSKYSFSVVWMMHLAYNAAVGWIFGSK